MATIVHEASFDSHDLYEVNFFNHQIETLVTDDPSMVDSWISNTEYVHRYRLHKLVVGLDVEWRPNFNRNFYHPIATLQLCVGHSCLIFQLLYAQEIPQSLSDFLNEPSYTFVGIGIDGDVFKLCDDYNLEVSNTVDLRGLAAYRFNRSDMRTMGLKVLARQVLGLEFEKPRSVTLSRWDKRYLSHAQVQYACIDAFISFEIGRILRAAN